MWKVDDSEREWKEIDSDEREGLSNKKGSPTNTTFVVQIYVQKIVRKKDEFVLISVCRKKRHRDELFILLGFLSFS